jgi:hypothetical protein
VRNGDTPLEQKDVLRAWIQKVVACFG